MLLKPSIIFTAKALFQDTLKAFDDFKNKRKVYEVILFVM